jgi:hypothetical protein
MSEMMMEMAGMQRLMMEMKPNPHRIPMVVKIGALLLVPPISLLVARFL